MITLGIIGVVAAMTMPSLIAEHQKKVTAKRLEQSYSILAQALNAAKAEHGDVSVWNINLNSLTASSVNREEVLTNFVETYLLPYLKPAQVYGYVTGSAIGIYNSGWNSYFFKLPNGSIIESTFATNCDDKGLKPDGNTCVGELLYTSYILKIYPNGKNSKAEDNRKNVFLTTLYPDGKYQMYGANRNRSTLLNHCSNNSSGWTFCGALIQIDGWEIAPDYPWKPIK